MRGKKQKTAVLPSLPSAEMDARSAKSSGKNMYLYGQQILQSLRIKDHYGNSIHVLT